MKKFKHLLTGTIFEKISDYILISEDKKQSVPLVITNNSSEWEEINDDPNNINNFVNGWRPLKELILKDIIDIELYIWCEFPAGGQSRKLKVDHIKGDYIYCDVEFVINKEDKYSRLPQGAVAYSYTKNDKSPYINETQKNIWRQIVNLTNVRQIFYKKI